MGAPLEAAAHIAYIGRSFSRSRQECGAAKSSRSAGEMLTSTVAALRVMESLEQTKAGIRFKAPKTDRARAITLPSFAVEELRRLKREQAEALLRVGIRQSGDTLVCCREDGGPR